MEDLDDPASLAEERALSTQAKRGDRRAFERLYDRFAPRLLAFLIWKLRNDRDLAKDILSETFRVAWEALRKFDPAGRSFYFWIHTIADNRAKNARRAAARAGRVFIRSKDDEDLPDGVYTDDIEGRVDLPKIQARVRATIAKIPNENYRKALTLQLIEQLPREQSAEIMGMKVLTFNTTLFRAHVEFRKLWKEAE